MSRKTTAQSNARELEKLYATKARGTKYTTVLHLVRQHGFAGAAAQLETWGHKLTEESVEPSEDPAAVADACSPAGTDEIYVRRRA